MINDSIMLYRLELIIENRTGDSTDITLRGNLSDLGQKALDDPSFKKLVDDLTLAASRVLEAHFHDENIESLYSGPGADAPAMQAFIKEVGAKPKPDIDAEEVM